LLTERIASRPWANALYGWWQRSRLSGRKVKRFVDSLGIDASEAELPLEQYRTLDAFFTRRLRPGARPIDDSPHHMVSPADGRALAFESVGPELVVKQCRVTLAELVDDASLAAAYEGGPALVIRLAPADYHRFHFPVEGVAGPARYVGGALHSVHPIALAQAAPSFANKRAISSLSSDRFGDLLMIEVGAMLVGTIEQTYRPGEVSRGDEKGLFRFGGSTVIVLARPGALVLDDDLVAASRDGVESLVQVGSRVGLAGEVR
jgi:phosphatidylserine decarboxylase